jgi:hypothetical protein
MSAEDQMAAPDTPGEPEPQVVSEQQATDATSYGDALLKLAADEGHVIGAAAAAPEPEEPEEQGSETETLPEEKPEEQEEEKAEAWPASARARVAEETARKRRATERAEKAEGEIQKAQVRIQELERSVATLTGPAPTEADPFNDIHTVNDLERLEKSYEKAIDLADDNPDGAIDVLVGRDKDGQEIRRDFTQEELIQMRRKAEKAVRKQIPERRTYLQQRALADAQAMEAYPELKDPQSEFSQQTAFLLYRLLSGQGMKEPDVAIWVARAVKGYRDELQRNGNTPGARNPAARKIIQSAQQQIAPTTTRTRSFPERRGADLVKAEKELERVGTPDAAEKYVAALFTKRATSTKRLEPLAE